MPSTIEFPAEFLWGAATSAYQIEGSPLADGAGPSIWQRFAHTPGLVHDGQTGDVACDHYRRYADDAAIMFRKLDDRVKLWATLNEPWVVTDGGYLHGAIAPGHRNRFEAPIATHNLLRAHGAAVRAYRAEGRHRIGLVVNLEPKYPA